MTLISYPLTFYVVFWRKVYLRSKLEKVTIAMHCNLRPSTPRQSFWALITRPIMHQPTNSTIPQKNISAIDEHLLVCFAKFVLRLCTSAVTAFLKFGEKRRSQVFWLYRFKIYNISIAGLFDLMTLNIHVCHIFSSHWNNFTNFDL